MRNIKLTISYDGTRYNGWQKQGNTPNTIQGKLNSILSSICREDIDLIGSGRTDAGVHAYNQIANFKTNAIIPLETLKAAINERLENDVCVKDATLAAPRFHARYNALGKKYLYRIWNHNDVSVFERKYSCHVREALDIEVMKTAAELFVGTHDFKAFTSDKRTKKSTVKEIYSIDITKNGDMLEILYHGNAFLYNMVRIMTGSLIEAGLSKIESGAVKEILERGDRAMAGHTAPPHGLFLKEVIFE